MTEDETKKPASGYTSGYISEYLKRSPRTFEEARKDYAIRQHPEADPEAKPDT